MKIHKVLSRQLNHYKLNEMTPPANIDEWQKFLGRINQTYTDFDQDRYMIDRSQEIASREIQELYRNLEDAEHIAHFGSWVYDIKNDRIRNSIEAERILGIDKMTQPVISYDNFLAIIINEDKETFNKRIQDAIQNNKDMESEIRITTRNYPYWINLKVKPVFSEEEQSIIKLSGTIIDVNQRKIEEQRKVMEQIVFNELVESKSVEETIKKVLQIICESFNWKLGIFWKWDDKKKLLIRESVWGENPRLIQSYLEYVPKDAISIDSHYLANQVCNTQQAFWLDITNDSRDNYSQGIKKLDIKTAFGFPIMGHEKSLYVLEVLDFSGVDKEQFNDYIAKNLNVVSQQLGLFIEKEKK